MRGSNITFVPLPAEAWQRPQSTRDGERERECSRSKTSTTSSDSEEEEVTGTGATGGCRESQIRSCRTTW